MNQSTINIKINKEFAEKIATPGYPLVGFYLKYYTGSPSTTEIIDMLLGGVNYNSSATSLEVAQIYEELDREDDSIVNRVLTFTNPSTSRIIYTTLAIFYIDCLASTLPSTLLSLTDDDYSSLSLGILIDLTDEKYSANVINSVDLANLGISCELLILKEDEVVTHLSQQLVNSTYTVANTNDNSFLEVSTAKIENSLNQYSKNKNYNTFDVAYTGVIDFD